MRTKLVVLGLVLPFGGMLMPGAVSAEPYRGTWEQQMACTPDVMRLCSDQIPDTNRIVACLRENTALLGRSCRAVFESNASVQQPSPGRASQPQAMQRPYAAQPVQPAPVAPSRPSLDDDDE